MKASGSAQPRTWGPTMMPSTISTITTGIATRGPSTVTVHAAVSATRVITRNEVPSTSMVVTARCYPR